MRVSDLPPHVNRISETVIGACIEVHRHLGPGLLESAYQQCVARELELRGVTFRGEDPLPVEYKGVRVDVGYRLDFVVEDLVVLEIKAVQALLPIHDAQVITYLKLTALPAALLINFHVTRLASGIRRFANTRPSNPADPRPPRLRGE